MLSPFGCAACGRGLCVLSGRLGKLRQAAALLIDKGEVLGAGSVRIKRRKRLLDIRIDLPGSKNLVVLAMLGDELVYVVVGVPQEVAYFVRELTGATRIAVSIPRERAHVAVIGAFCGIAACQRDARSEMHKGRGQVADVVAFRGKRRRGAGVGEISHEVRRAAHIDERSAGAPDQNAHMDSERLDLAVALGYDGEQARASLFDLGDAEFSVLVGVNAGIGKERSRLDACERRGAVAYDSRLICWDVNGSSHVAPFESSFVSLGKLIHESKPRSTKKFEEGN